MTFVAGAAFHSFTHLQALRDEGEPFAKICASKRSRCGAVRIVLLAVNPLRRSCALAVALCQFVLSLANPLRRLRVLGRSRCGAVRICLAGGPLRRSCESTRACCGACELVLPSAIPLRRFCASKRSRCGAVQICLELGKPSAEILRVEALSLRRRANASCSWRTLCGDPARRSALARRRANASCSRRTLCEDPACRSALAVAPLGFLISLLANRCLDQSSGCNIATSKRKSSTRSPFLGSCLFWRPLPDWPHLPLVLATSASSALAASTLASSVAPIAASIHKVKSRIEAWETRDSGKTT